MLHDPHFRIVWFIQRAVRHTDKWACTGAVRGGFTPRFAGDAMILAQILSAVLTCAPPTPKQLKFHQEPLRASGLDHNVLLGAKAVSPRQGRFCDRAGTKVLSNFCRHELASLLPSRLAPGPLVSLHPASSVDEQGAVRPSLTTPSSSVRITSERHGRPPALIPLSSSLARTLVPPSISESENVNLHPRFDGLMEHPCMPSRDTVR